jgi:hypothetical protein
MRVAFLLLLSVLGLAACGESARKSACSVFDNGDGTRTIVCGEESLVVPGTADGTTCVKSPAADGGAIIACTDGTTVVLDADGNVVHRGAGGVVGRVTLYGETDHSGTVVRAVGTEHSTVTDEKGDFYLAGLDAGVYDLSIEREGWAPLLRRNTIAVGGILYLEPMLLRRGMRLGRGHEYWVSPAEDSVLVREGRSLWLHFPGDPSPVELSPNVATTGASLPADGEVPAFSADGGAVVFLDNLDPGTGRGRIRRHDVAGGSTVTVAEDAMVGIPLADGAVLVWRAREGEDREHVGEGEVVVVYPDGGQLVLGVAAVDRTQLSISPGGRAVGLGTGTGLVIADVAARESFSPGSAARVLAWSPDGARAVLVTPDDNEMGTGTLYLLDLASRGVTVLAEGARAKEVSFSADGNRILYLANHGGVSGGEFGPVYLGDLEVFDVRTLTRTVAPEASGGFYAWDFTPGGEAVLYRRAAGLLVHWQVAAATATPLGSTRLEEVVWSPRGDRLVFVDGSTCRLVRFDASGAPASFPRTNCGEIHFLPDGEWVAVVVKNEEGRWELRRWAGGGDGGELLVHLPGTAADLGLRFSENGATAAWVESADGGKRVLKVQNTSGGAAGSLPPADALDFNLVPNGSFAWARTMPELELLVYEVASGQVTRLDGPVDGIAGYDGFVIYGIDPVDDEASDRQGTWLACYPRESQ